MPRSATPLVVAAELFADTNVRLPVALAKRSQIKVNICNYAYHYTQF